VRDPRGPRTKLPAAASNSASPTQTRARPSST
jgi:hypothetical protein